jgi:hypothetical protein
VEIYLLAREDPQGSGELNLTLSRFRVDADLPDGLDDAPTIRAVRPFALVGPDWCDPDLPRSIAECEDHEGIPIALGLFHPVDDQELVLDALTDRELTEVQRRHVPMVQGGARSGKLESFPRWPSAPRGAMFIGGCGGACAACAAHDEQGAGGLVLRVRSPRA